MSSSSSTSVQAAADIAFVATHTIYKFIERVGNSISHGGEEWWVTPLAHSPAQIRYVWLCDDDTAAVRPVRRRCPRNWQCCNVRAWVLAWMFAFGFLEGRPVRHCDKFDQERRMMTTHASRNSLSLSLSPYVLLYFLFCSLSSLIPIPLCRDCVYMYQWCRWWLGVRLPFPICAWRGMLHESNPESKTIPIPRASSQTMRIFRCGYIIIDFFSVAALLIFRRDDGIHLNVSFIEIRFFSFSSFSQTLDALVSRALWPMSLLPWL